MDQVNSTVTITKKAASRLRAGHLWIYSTDLIDAHEANNGDVVEVSDERRRSLGYALYSRHSKIALRWIAPAGARVGVELWQRRLLDAAHHRERVVTGTDAFRLVFGESDLLPSLIIDRYGDAFVIQTLTPGMEKLKPTWVDLLVETYNPRAIVERNDIKVRQLEGLDPAKGLLHGTLDEAVILHMNGLRFCVDLLSGQKTGAFLDQRENYLAAARYARGKALDCFCYAGAFSLHMAPRCESVLAIDSSAEALVEARQNAELNGCPNIEFIEANVFDRLRRMVKEKRRFDTIVLDPPAFAKSRESLEGALRGYKEINLRALQLLEPGGILLTCSCSYQLSEELFLGVLASAAADTGRQIRIIEKRMQARDHPVLLSMPETYYLKCIVAQMI